jgi:PAS domain S-box-containing protein
VSVRLLRGPDGQPAHFITVIQDITAREAAEAETHLSRQRLELHVQRTPLAVVEFTVDGLIAGWNPAATEIFGYPADEALGRHWTLIAPESRLDQLEGVWKSLISLRGGSRSTNLNRHRSGRLVDCEWFNTPLIAADGTVLGVASLVMDVTERRLAQEELARHRDHLQELVRARTAELADSEARLVDAQRTAGVGNWEWNVRRDIVTGSREFYRLFDAAPEELARFEQFVERLHPDDRGPVAREVELALRDSRLYDIGYRVRLRDGGWRYLQARGTTFTDDGGQPDRMAGTCLDVTEARRSQESLKELNASLARSNEELEQFAYVASHDLQEPLRMVASYTQLLAERYQGQLDARADRYIAYAVDGAKRMQGLINDLLTLSRVGTRTIPFAPVRCDEVIAEVVRDLGKAIEDCGARLSLGPLPTVLADRTQLGQVFHNLLANALKFRGEATPALEVSARREGARWRLCVADNGIGIAPQYHERIFIIFQRLCEWGKYPGSGIGLAIVKKIVERHGGRVQVESAAGEGARFSFTMPAANDEER